MHWSESNSFNSQLCKLLSIITDTDECVVGTHNCDHDCTNTDGSYTCSCNDGLILQPDGHSCQCGGVLTATSGSFQTEGWPNSYRQDNFQCEWVIRLPNNDATIQFTIDQSAFGTLGNPSSSCNSDNIQFFDGMQRDAESLKICGLRRFYGGLLPTIHTTSSVARVVFTGTRYPKRPASRVGVKVHYITVPPPGEQSYTPLPNFKRPPFKIFHYS